MGTNTVMQGRADTRQTGGQIRRDRGSGSGQTDGERRDEQGDRWAVAWPGWADGKERGPWLGPACLFLETPAAVATAYQKSGH